MKLSKEALEELKDIYKKEFSEEISDNDAQEMARRLLRLIALLRYKPRHTLTFSEGNDSIDQKN